MTRVLLFVALFKMFFTVSAVYAAEVPAMLTVSRVSQEAKDYLKGAVQHNLENTPSEGAIELSIDGKSYYFMPSDGENYEVLQNLANIGGGALKRLDDSVGAVYQLTLDDDTFYYGYDEEKLPESGYSLVKLDEKPSEDADILYVAKYEQDAEGNLVYDENGSLVEIYYEVKLPEIELGTSKNVSWKEISEEEAASDNANVVTVEISEGVVKYYRYAYNKPDSRTVYETQQSSLSGDVDADFVGSNDYAGGAIYNYYNTETIENITGDFIGNSAVSANRALGGAIYNTASTIGNITGNFIQNYAKSTNEAAQGGVIYNKFKLGDITGDFIGNYAHSVYEGVSGGAIFNNEGYDKNNKLQTAIIGNITGNFIGNYAKTDSGYKVKGGAISNDVNAAIGNITGNFIGNYVEATTKEANGGAVYNERSTIGSVTGDFIGNYGKAGSGSVYGGAIHNAGSNSQIGNITGDFIGNYGVSNSTSFSRYVYGGAIYNSGSNAKIGNITGDFIGNYGKVEVGYVFGGAVSNLGAKIGDITGDFIGNYGELVSGSSKYVYGGAVYNSGSNAQISNITGNFIGNYGVSNSSSSNTISGGAIYNNGSNVTIGNISGDFIGNYASTDYQNKRGYGYGGAIYNGGTIEQIANSNFIDNYVRTGNKAQGGAIWTSKDLNIVADNGSSTFKGNYVQIGSEEKDYQAIWVNSASATLNLTAKSAGAINLYDNINGAIGYKVNITGDETGTLNLYNDIKNADVTVKNVTMNLANGETHDYVFKSLASNENAGYVIDVDLENKKADTITTESASSGTITIAGLQISNALENPDKEYKIQILYTQSDALQLALSKELQNKLGEASEDIYAEINATTNWNDKYKLSVEQTDFYGTVGLATTNTTNDSIGISDIRTEKVLIDKGLQGDTLALWNGLDTTEKKEFNFDSADDKYVVGSDFADVMGLGETKGSTLYINGVSNGKNSSTIDLNGRKGFEVSDNDTTLYLKDVNIINGNGGAIYSAGDVFVTADNGTSLFRGNTVSGKSEAIYMDGADLSLSAVNGGTILFDDGIDGENYNININTDSATVLASEIDDEEEDVDAEEPLNKVVFNNLVDHVSSFNLASGSTVRLGKNAVINVKDYISDGATLEVDLAVDVDSPEKSVQNGIINVEGEVKGSTSVIVRAENPDTLEGIKTEFVNAPNFEGGKAEQFGVSRVYGSPYMWRTVMNAGENESGSHWYLALTDEKNKDFDASSEPGPKPDVPGVDPKPSRPVYAPEVAAYVGLQSAAVEQNRNIADSVANGLAYRKSLNCYQESCGIAEIMPKKHAWIDVTHENAEIDAPEKMDAKINGATFGLDLYREGIHRAGLFGAYRHGKYDLSGKGKYSAATGADIRSKSYLGGAYYQYDDSEWRMTGTVFVGTLDMDIKTADRVAWANTDVTQYGASAELVKRYVIGDYLNLEPSLGLYYTMLDVDGLQDNVGKRAEFEYLHYLEAEFGLKIEREFCNNGETNRLYVKPSIIQTFNEGGKTKISGLKHRVQSYKNATLGRIEVGADVGFDENWNGWAHTGYTLGEDYNAYDFTMGLTRRF